MSLRRAALFCLMLSVLAGASGAQMTNTVYPATGTPFSPPSSADSNSDGWPDNPIAALGDGDLWVSIGGPRSVAALRWSDDVKTQSIDVEVPRVGGGTQRILVESPGTLADGGEIAVLLVGVAPDLTSLFGAAQASEFEAHEDAELLTGGQYVEISVLVSDDNGATFDEIDPVRLQDAPIRVRFEDMIAPVDAFPVLYEHPTYIASDPSSGLAPLAESGSWTAASCVTLPHDETAPNDEAQPVYIEAELRSLSVFAPLDAALANGTGSTENGTGGGTSENESGEITLGGEETFTSGGPLSEGGESLIDGPGGGGQTSLMLGPGDPVWVDFGESGYEDGTEENPYNLFAEGVWVAAVNGSDSVLIDRRTPIYRSGESGSYNPPHTISVEAVNGPVRIGESTATLFTYFTGIGAVVYEPVGESLSGLSYAINPEQRTFPEGAAITVKAYPAEGYKFDGWWFPEDPSQTASQEDLLVAGIHSFVLEKNRLLWPVFTENETNLDVADPDEDGIANFREAELGTNPNNPDSDGDTMPDWWEINYGLDPLSASGTAGASGNPDGDEWTNGAEFGFGSSPINPLSVNYQIEQGFKGVAVQFVSPGVTPSVDGRVIEVVTDSLNTYYSQAPAPAPTDHYRLHTRYRTGDEVTWRFTPTEPYQDFVVLKWLLGTGSNNVLGTGNEVTFIANWWHYYPNTPPPPPNVSVESQITLVLRGPIPSDAELKGVRVTAPGPFGNAFFESEMTEWGTPDGAPLERKMEQEAHPERVGYPRAAEVYFDAIRERTINGDIAGPFVVELQGQLDTSFSEETFDVIWSFHDDSIQAGRLIGDGLNARLEFDNSNPPVPGLYKIRCEVRVNGEKSAPPSRTAVAYVLLPFAGPDVQDWIIQEARQIVDGTANNPGVGEQWVEYMLDEGPIPIIDVPFIGEVPFDPLQRMERAFASVAAFRFDYTQIMFLYGLERPTRKYSYGLNESGESNADRLDHVNFPAYATVDNTVLVRGRINVILFTVWAKAVFFATTQHGYPANPSQDSLLLDGAWLNNLGKGIKKLALNWTLDVEDIIDDPTATETGIELYNAIRENWSDAQIKEHVLTPDRALGMQTINPNVYDRALWPRGDYEATPNTTPWVGNDGLVSQGRFDRPYIFLQFENMDMNPWTASNED